jgi:lysozyme
MDPVKQAEFFCGVFGKLGGNDLSPVMDWETTDGVASVNDRENGYSFLNSVEQLSGRTPIIYGSPYFLEALSLDSRFLRFPLWTAHYGVKAPLVPAPWTTWSFWQYSGTGAVDLDYYTGIFPLFVNAEPLINNLAPLEGLKPVIPVVL